MSFASHRSRAADEGHSAFAPQQQRTLSAGSASRLSSASCCDSPCSVSAVRVSIRLALGLSGCPNTSRPSRAAMSNGRGGDSSSLSAEEEDVPRDSRARGSRGSRGDGVVGSVAWGGDMVVLGRGERKSEVAQVGREKEGVAVSSVVKSVSKCAVVQRAARSEGFCRTRGSIRLRPGV